MASTTIGKSDSCIALLTFDPAGLTASSITIANLSGTNAVFCQITVLGIQHQVTAGIGQSAVMNFAPALILLNTTPTISDLNSFGMATI